MPTLTIRFYIDGEQVDDVEADGPTEAELRSMIEDVKRGLSKEDWTTRFSERSAGGMSAGLREALERLGKAGDK